jgi:hypothetical protein
MRSGIPALFLVAGSLWGADSIDFQRDVEPIFRTRCVLCHGSQQQLSGLRLDRRDDAFRGGYSGVVIKPRDPEGSRLIQLVSGKGKIVMPPAGPRLTEREILILTSWIDQGAPWVDDSNQDSLVRTRSTHWSFQPLRKPPVPPVRKPAWSRNAIDAFVLDRLKREGIKPSPEADRHTLLRRVSFDLVGLPPSPEELSRFMADTEAGAYERAVDRLLSSPHFGEKWARHWLDLARYADSDGYEQDQVRPHAWRYRDWVIRAFNDNVPFDRFSVDQIAGDLLPGSKLEQKTATGFHRNTLTSREGGIDVEQLRTEQVADRAATVGTVWLGLTLECARCHDHKYDPVTQKEFYQFYSFFNSAVEVNIEDPVPGELGPYLENRPEYLKKYSEIKDRYRVDELQQQWEREVLSAMADPAARLEWTQVLDYLAVYQDHGHEILKTPSEKRTFRQSHDLTRVFLKYPGPLASWPEAKGIRFSEGFNQLEELDAKYPGLSEIPVIAEGPARTTHIFIRGDFRNPGIEVQPGTPAVLPPLPESSDAARLRLARWIVSSDNPLIARVAVNRFWQELFGRGLVSTSEDLGKRGDPPSHPELLDWLAASFRDQGWNVKALIRQIVLSATYRQSSPVREDLVLRDPENRLLARQNRLRLSAELVRDATLAVSGLLNPAVGGRSVRPPMPAGMLRVAYRVKWEETPGPGRYRRGLYTLFQRSLPHPQMAAFDAPGSLIACSRRERSVTPLQALSLLNAPEFYEAARALAARILREKSETFEERAQYAFELCLNRTATPEELAAISKYHQMKLERQKADTRSAEQQAPGSVAAGFDPQVAAAWTGIASILLNLDEFITRE